MFSKAALVAGVLAACAAGASATSSGRFIFDCNALSADMGCEPNGFNNYESRFDRNPNRNGFCRDRANGPNNGTREMHWAFQSVRSDQYRVRVTKGNAPETDAQTLTSYQPGELLDIHVRVMQGSPYMTNGYAFHDAPFAQRPTAGDFLATAFRGLMLHFQQSSDNNADGAYVNATNGFDAPNAPGEWVVSVAEPPLFHLPAGSCGDSNEVLMHATGGYKPTYLKFHYRAPPAGTGPIALRALIKSGDANWGWFWWPNMEGDVVLQEGAPYTAPAETVAWTRGELGESCDAVCARTTIEGEATGCDIDAMTNLNTASGMLGVTAQGNPLACELPIVGLCGNLGPTSAGDSNVCYYAETNARCTADGRDATAPTCEAWSADVQTGRRLCPCTTEAFSAAPGAATPVVALAAAAIAAVAGASRSTLVVVLALACVLASAAEPAAAHNWLRSKSRAAFASTAAPFPSRTSTAPHAHVAFDQKFQVEWVLGHTRETYWVVTHVSNAGRLKEIRDQDLDDYIDQAPAGQADLHLDVSWRRWHRRRGRYTLDSNDPSWPSGVTQILVDPRANEHRNDNGVYEFPVFFASNHRDDAAPVTVNGRTQGADDRIVRSDAFSGSGSVPTNANGGRVGLDTGTYFRLEYNDADLSLDGRAKYMNPTWPYILEVARCEHNVDQPSRPDVLNIAITKDDSRPDRAPAAGHYLAWWRWRGYYDIVDVDVIEGPDVPTDEVYGEAYGDGAPFRRVEHAMFANPRAVWPWRRMDMQPGSRCSVYRGSAESCIQRCNRVGSTGILACDGVNVWPLYPPAQVNTNLIRARPDGLNPMIPWANETYGCNPADFIGMPTDTRICAAVAGRYAVDDRQPIITTTQDPEDNVWYNVIFTKDTGRNFTNLSPNSPFLQSEPDLSWRFGHKCVKDCSELTRYTGFTAGAQESAEEGCVNCEFEPAPVGVQETDVAKMNPIYADSRCGTDDNDNAVFKLITPAGYTEATPSFSAFDCAAEAALDPECGDLVMRQQGENSNRGRSCRCVRAGVTCDRRDRGGWDVLQLDAAAPAADPTCAQGTLNSAGDKCCLASCTQDQCDNDNNGECSGSLNRLRSCDVAGAPCAPSSTLTTGQIAATTA